MRRNPRYDKAKFRELVLYVAEKSADDPHFGAVKLNKLLFYADFASYQNTGEPITGSRYQKLEFGPAPRPLLPVLKELEEEGRCQTVHSRLDSRQKRVIPTGDVDLGLFSQDEIALIDDVVEAFRGHNASQVSALSHRFIGWEVAEIGEDIGYQTALVADPRPLTPSEIEYGRELYRERQAAQDSH